MSREQAFSLIQKLGRHGFEAKVSWLDVKPAAQDHQSPRQLGCQTEGATSIEVAEGFVPPAICQPVTALLRTVACVEQVLTAVPVDA